MKNGFLEEMEICERKLGLGPRAESGTLNCKQNKNESAELSTDSNANIEFYSYLTSSKYSINSKYMNIVEIENL